MAKRAILTREQILGADDLPHVEVEIPEWGGAVYVKRLTAKERLELSGQAGGKEGLTFMACVVIACVVDADNRPLLEPSDADALAGKAGSVVQRLFNYADTLNGFTQRAEVDVEKN